MFTYNNDTCSLSSAEFEGRHPCVISHNGQVLHFAGEDKEDFADTAPHKKRGSKSRAKSKPSSKRQGKKRAIHSDEEESSDDISDEDLIVPSPQFVHAGLPSPSSLHATEWSLVRGNDR